MVKWFPFKNVLKKLIIETISEANIEEAAEDIKVPYWSLNPQVRKIVTKQKDYDSKLRGLEEEIKTFQEKHEEQLRIFQEKQAEQNEKFHSDVRNDLNTYEAQAIYTALMKAGSEDPTYAKTIKKTRADSFITDMIMRALSNPNAKGFFKELNEQYMKIAKLERKLAIVKGVTISLAAICVAGAISAKFYYDRIKVGNTLDNTVYNVKKYVSEETADVRKDIKLLDATKVNNTDFAEKMQEVNNSIGTGLSQLRTYTDEQITGLSNSYTEGLSALESTVTTNNASVSNRFNTLVQEFYGQLNTQQEAININRNSIQEQASDTRQLQTNYILIKQEQNRINKTLEEVTNSNRTYNSTNFFENFLLQ